MKVAVIGGGFMGETHLEAYSRLAHVEVVGVCNPKSDPLRLAGQFGTTAFTSFEQMLSTAKPEVVSICLPTHLHKEYVIKAAEAGVHIICEKPIAPTLSDAKEMIEVCKRSGVRLFIAHVLRFFPNYQDIQRQIASGAIGDVGVVHTKRVVGHPGVNTWYNDPALSGGVIMDLMIHDIDFVRSVLGEVHTVYAMRRKAAEVEHALVTFKFESGAIANLEGLWGYESPLTSSCEFAGKKGIIRLNSENTATIRIKKATEEDPSSFESIPKSPTIHDPFYDQLGHFIECIREDKEPLVTVDDAYKAVELSLAAIRSAETGAPVTVKHMTEDTAVGGKRA